MKGSSLKLVVLILSVFLAGCLVLGAPRRVQLRSTRSDDSIQLVSFPNGFYRYEYFPRAVQADSMRIYDPIGKKMVAMKKDSLNIYYYDFRARISQRESLGNTVVHHFLKGHERVDTLRYNGSLRKF